MEKFNNTVRADIVKMIHNAKSGHPGGALSCVEILKVLYQKIMFVPVDWKNNKDFDNRDRFILSKGHASACLYSILARMGFFSPDLLTGFRIFGSKLQGHPSLRTNLNGIEVSTGSLGQGLSIGVGVALGLKSDKKNSKVFVLMGDGEMQEGSVWEALMNASHNKLDNIILIIDRNKLQIDGATKDVMSLEPLDKKLAAFGWQTNTVDGHDEIELEKALSDAKNAKNPVAVIANTIKGKGISFMENNSGWHGKAPNDAELKLALEELNA